MSRQGLRPAARAVGLAVALLTLTASVALGATTAPGVPNLILGPHLKSAGGPPTSSYCIANYGIACYGPQDMRNQYDFNPEYTAGNNGSGQTIVIFDSFGSPTIQQDLANFDSSYQIPAPPSFHIYQPEGKVTYPYVGASPSAVKANKNFQTEIGWGYETTLDVEWAHAMAPGANIALVETPVAETQGVQGLQNLQNAQKWALDNHIGTTWSNSYATTEQAFQNPSVIRRLNGFYRTAAQDGISGFFATGDSGVANTDKQGRLFPYPTVNFPTSSPDVIAVGGTEIPVPQAALANYNPEAVWNDCCGSGGGGYSSVFGEPYYQSQAGIPDPNGMRGVPDVSYNAALISSILIYESFDPTAPPGWLPIGGTSAATPQWAAIDAIANQADGPLGFLTPRLYQIYNDPAAYGLAFHDITQGNNSWAGVTGYSAVTGWDAATGLGTPDVSNLVTALASTTPGTAP
ncbi:MAG TPA: S53 family peptidase [Solirubrobacteraceae bacterium]|nr:S53 family peptidase [Solirubrobacteraceae bacterium]